MNLTLFFEVDTLYAQFWDPEILGDRTCGESQFFDVTHLSESQSRRDFA
jgi:hypothetical protein